mgnify:CR=1 FL=1
MNEKVEILLDVFEPEEWLDNTAQTKPLHPVIQSWLDKWNDFRSANWLDILEFPELTLQCTQQLLIVA